MKVITGKTTFEFTKEDIEALNTCYQLFVSIYCEMTPGDIFCGYNDLDFKINILTFFAMVVNELDEATNNTITCL